MVFTKENIDLAISLQRRAIEKSLTLSTAESCTGGLLGGLLTSLPGSSAYYLGGITPYANEAKTRCLGVKLQTLKSYGAVSEQTAGEMLSGIIRKFGSDLGVSITGIAGPTGGSKDKPVGTVWIGVRTNKINRCFLYNFHGDRNKIRMDTIRETLTLLNKNL